MRHSLPVLTAKYINKYVSDLLLQISICYQSVRSLIYCSHSFDSSISDLHPYSPLLTTAKLLQI